MESAQLQLSSGQVILASDLSLTLDSRTLAVGEAGSAAVKAWLLRASDAEGQTQELQEGIAHHEALKVAYFGPTSCGSSSPAAIVARLTEQCPQVVVLDEAFDVGDGAWSQTFAEVLCSEAFRDFRGAIVVCAAEVNQQLARVCSRCWDIEEGSLCQEPCLDVIENALEAAPTGLLEEVMKIEECDLANWIDRSREEDWKVTLFCHQGRLTGLICHHMIEGLAEFKVELVFVPSMYRGLGFGKRLVRWVIERAAHMPQSTCNWISLNALDSRVSFYEQFGFTDLGSSDSKRPDTTWMELKNASLIPEDV